MKSSPSILSMLSKRSNSTNKPIILVVRNPFFVSRNLKYNHNSLPPDEDYCKEIVGVGDIRHIEKSHLADDGEEDSDPALRDAMNLCFEAFARQNPEEVRLFAISFELFRLCP